MKKKLLFVIDSLRCGGAEKSLVTLLSLIDYSKYSVDLQLFSYNGDFEIFLNDKVNLLPPLPLTDFLNKPLYKQFFYALFKRKWKFLSKRMLYSFLLRKNCDKLNNAMIARLYWTTYSSAFKNTKEYDAAIGYGQALPTFYVSEKAIAKKKLSWINAKYTIQGEEKLFQYEKYARLDKIVLVTEELKQIFQTVYPEFSERMVTINDILYADLIKKMARNGDFFKKEEAYQYIVTIGRLNKHAKGFDILMNVCLELSKRDIPFKWYIIGEGPYRAEMEDFLKRNNLQESVFLLGLKTNPYSYLSQADLYVQTSRHEGFGLSIAEARLLNVPVVTTEFDVVYNQMVPGENGLVVPQDPVQVADAIERILKDKSLYKHIVSYLKQEKKGNPEEVEKFYHLIEE